MIEQVQKVGVKKYYGEDLLQLQSESLYALQKNFEQYGNLVISGCNVNGTTIESGIVGVSGIDANGDSSYKVCRFEGASNVSFPAYLILSYSVNARDYEDGVSKPISYNYFATLSGTVPSSNYVKILSTGPETRFVDAIQDSEHRMVTDAKIAYWDSAAASQGGAIELTGQNKLYRVASIPKNSNTNLNLIVSNSQLSGNEGLCIYNISSRGTNFSAKSYLLTANIPSEGFAAYLQIYDDSNAWTVYLRSESFCYTYSIMVLGKSTINVSITEISTSPTGTSIYNGKTDSLRILTPANYGSGNGMNSDMVDGKHAEGALNTSEKSNLTSAINELVSTKVATSDTSVTPSANKIPIAGSNSKISFSTTGDAGSVGGKTASQTLQTSEKNDLVGAINEVRSAALIQFPIGGIMMWPAPLNTIPSNFKLCDGTSLSQTTYADLYAAIGTTYGGGSGQFLLPDLVNLFIVGARKGLNGYYDLGDTGGESTHALTINEMPWHNHRFFSDRLMDASVGSWTRYGTSSYTVQGDSNRSTAYEYYTTNEGLGVSHENKPPYMALYYIIRVL